MKNLLLIQAQRIFSLTIVALFLLSSPTLFGQSKQNSIYGYEVKTIDGNIISMKTFLGKKLMIVNVASECGLTPQYEELQTLYTKYQGDGFVIVAFPSNDFNEQEPGSDSEIKSFCSLNFGVSFPLMSKIKVIGQDKSPIYRWLTTKALNNVGDYKVEWNFQKFLINPDGSLYKVIAPKISPNDSEITDWIEL